MIDLKPVGVAKVSRLTRYLLYALFSALRVLTATRSIVLRHFLPRFDEQSFIHAYLPNIRRQRVGVEPFETPHKIKVLDYRFDPNSLLYKSRTLCFNKLGIGSN
jgi:hypothetical protein